MIVVQQLISFYYRYCQGSCTDLLSLHPFGIREPLISHIIWQLVQALRYLHERHIMHRYISIVISVNND
jgi:serine/threonine protein kinase